MTWTQVLSSGTPRTLAVLGAMTVAPAFGFANDSTPDFQYDPVEHWAARVLLWVLVASLIVVAYLIIRARQGRMTGRRANSLLVVGVILLPSFSVATGLVLVFTRAERVEFCASCHGVMQDYVDDMSNSEGTGLAAIHFAEQYIPSNQCYECHTSFGLFGTVKAKVHGVEEVLRYYSGRYSKPLEMWQPYSNADCLKCHARSRTWLKVDAHTADDAKVDLFVDRVSCMDCHEPGHRVAALWETAS